MRARRLVLRPRVALPLLAAVSAAAHAAVALLVHSLLIFPDEWLYAGLSRSFITDHPGRIHGGAVSIGTTISYVGPLVTAPLWLFDNVSLAYHLSQAVASLAFASAVFPVYLLARRVGVTERGALVAAVLSQLIPAGIYTSTLLAEPFAYPAFLAAVLLAVYMLAAPTVAKALGLLVAAVGLCFVGGLQFLFFPLACAGAWIASAASLAGGARRLLACAAAAAALVTALEVAGAGTVPRRVWDGAVAEHYRPGALAGWFLINLFVLALASGWVIVPAAASGTWRFARSADAALKGFGWLLALVLVATLAEAAIWGANKNGVYERFTFYASPLIAIAFLREVEAPPRSRRRVYAGVGYALAVAVLLAPLVSQLTDHVDHSPTMLGLAQGVVVRLHSPPLVWAPALALLAVVAAAFGATRSRLLAAAAAGVLVVAAAAGMRTLVDRNGAPIPRLRLPPNTALLGNPIEDDAANGSMEFLFWNPHLERVVVLDGLGSPDGVPAIDAKLTGPRRIESQDGSPVPGPFAVRAGTTVWTGAPPMRTEGPGVVERPPRIVAFGWGREGLSLFSELLASLSRTKNSKLVFRLRSLDARPVRISVSCDFGRRRSYVVTARQRGVDLAIDVPAGAVQRCEFSPVSAHVHERGGRSVIAQARLVRVRTSSST